MPDTQEQENTSLMTMGAQAGAQKAGEFFVDKALNAILDGCVKKYGNTKVRLGSGFTRYLKNATERYNQVQTIATGNIVRSIIGPDNIYVSIGVRHGKKKISTDTVEPMLSVSKNLLVEGTGGIGKSMMMRYLFLNTANRGEYIPVLLELRKISKQSLGHISIMDLIYTCMKDFDIELPREQFEFSLQMGKYLFLMDGFDEVKESMALETAEQIQKFCSKYPNNPCIITTRPGRDTTPLETFTTVASLPLSKEQAVMLAKKIWDEDEKTREFCRQLEDELFRNKKHREFAENPLLLTMMFLTFMRNNSLPDHLAEFYRQAFEALYSTHDSKNKGAYRREFKCDTLDAPGFRRILSHFCFQSFFNQDYEFNEEKLLSYINKSIKKLGFITVSAEDYFLDLKKVVCLLVKDGEEYRFAHRSFQAYFAACYTAEALNDEQQKKVLLEFVCRKNWRNNRDYLDILDQLEHERMTVNLLEDTIRLYLNKAHTTENPARSYAKMVAPNAIIVVHEEGNPGSNRVAGYYIIPDSNGIDFNWYQELFYRFVLRDNKLADSTYRQFSFWGKEWSILDRISLQKRQQVDVGLWAFTPFGVTTDFLNDQSFMMPEEFGITEYRLIVCVSMIAGLETRCMCLLLHGIPLNAVGCLHHMMGCIGFLEEGAVVPEGASAAGISCFDHAVVNSPEHRAILGAGERCCNQGRFRISAGMAAAVEAGSASVVMIFTHIKMVIAVIMGVCACGKAAGGLVCAEIGTGGRMSARLISSENRDGSVCGFRVGISEMYSVGFLARNHAAFGIGGIEPRVMCSYNPTRNAAEIAIDFCIFGMVLTAILESRHFSAT